MNSIDNLREYVLTAPSICSTTRAILVGYIDGIEREVKDMVPMPLDADGVPIHVGDVMEWSDGSTCEVVGIGNGGTLYYMDELEGTVGWTNAEGKHHHHAPTVEDVLREFAEKIIDSQIPNVHPTYDEAIAEYAAKLRLAGDE